MNALDVGKITAKTQVRQLAFLSGGFGNVRKRICARVIVEQVVPREKPDIEQRAGAEQVSPGRREIVRLDLCALILAGRHCIKRVRILEPGTRIAAVQMNRIGTTKLQIHAVEHVLLITLGMNDLEFRWIEETARIQAVRRDEIAPLRSSKRYIEARIIRTETPVRSAYTSNRLRLAQARTRCHLDDQARLVSKFRGRRARDHFQ